jgi:hypothetical protein
MVGALCAIDKLLGVDPLCVHLRLHFEGIALPRLGERVEETVAHILRAPHEGPHVGRVVPEGPVLAAAEATVDAEHQQEHDEHDPANRNSAAYEDGLLIRALRPLRP